MPPSPNAPSQVEPQVRKACINCRKQKMKCIPATGRTDACRRCHRAGLSCIFVPRANAATLPVLPMVTSPSEHRQDGQSQSSILQRLKVIEECLGLSTRPSYPKEATVGSSELIDDMEGESGVDEDENSLGNNPAMVPLWNAVAVLKESCPSNVPPSVWHKTTVAGLWSSFHERMPGLHFMPDRQTFSSPQPILLASMLYCSSTRGPPDVAELGPHYFTVLCHAIGHLSIPGNAISRMLDESALASGEWAFQTVLGIVLTGLLTEANVREVGIWISVAYRLLLEHCPAHGDESTRQWRRLFSGLQIVDLEHASLHLSCPVVPIESPLSVLQSSHSDQLYRLSRMMHAGLSHFTGRKLPTIWSCFTSNDPMATSVNLTSSFTAVDAAVIRDWARQLDEWLVEFTNSASAQTQGASTEQQLDSKLIFRQYVLHRLVVLSIYHPARGCNLWARNISPVEQHELLLSARATLKLHLHDDTIWANWDLVMLTWAALITIQAVEGGIHEADDMTNIRLHLDMLRRQSGSKPSLRDKLVSRLEGALQGIQTPDATLMPQHDQQLSPNSDPACLDYSWQIFNQVSLQQFDSII